MNSKAKGSSFERLICKQLSRWVTEDAREDIFWRSINSGAQWTNTRSKKKGFEGHVGDIAAIDPLGEWFISKFALELKHYQDLQVDNVIFGLPSKLETFWNTHKRLCFAAHKLPILIAKQNRKPELVILPTEVCLVFNEIRSAIKMPTGYCLMPFHEFLKTVTYREFKDRLEINNIAFIETI